MNNPLIEGVDFYYTNNLLVFTEQYHIEKGYCCGLGCRHCPYDLENVPEQKPDEIMKSFTSEDGLNKI